MGSELPTIKLEHQDLNYGDYSTSVAMVLAKELKQSPVAVAKNIVSKLNETKSENILKVEMAGPGFINFYLKKEFFAKSIKDIIKAGDKFGQNSNLAGQKTIIEFTDPNPFKEFHIGHLMSNAIGESISRIIEAAGSKVIRVSYGGDIGLHVAKAIWGYRQLERYLGENKSKIVIYEQEREIISHEKEASFWGLAYAFGASEYDADAGHKIEIDELNKEMFFSITPETKKIYEQGRKVSIEHFQTIFKRLGTNFEHNFWESEVVGDAMKAVEEGLAKNILEKSEGAIIFKGENYGLHTRVFVNSKGVPTYEAKELGLGVKKIELYNFDKSIIITGNEQNDYFKVLLTAIGLLRPQVKDKTTHIGHGMLRFTSGKMSSRKGNVITGVLLLEQVQEIISEKMKERNFSPAEKETLAEIISVGAIKYSILRQANGKDIIFDFDKSLSFEGDSGPYLQYSCVRAKAVLAKAKEAGIGGGLLSIFKKVEKFGAEVSELEKVLYRFPEIVERAGSEYAPHYLVTYLTDLAGKFNSYYAQNKIIDKGDKDSVYKVELTRAFAQTIENGLNLLGIRVPDKM